MHIVIDPPDCTCVPADSGGWEEGDCPTHSAEPSPDISDSLWRRVSAQNRIVKNVQKTVAAYRRHAATTQDAQLGMDMVLDEIEAVLHRAAGQNLWQMTDDLATTIRNVWIVVTRYRGMAMRSEGARSAADAVLTGIESVLVPPRPNETAEGEARA